MKKVVALILSLLFMLSIVGCKSKGNTNSSVYSDTGSQVDTSATTSDNSQTSSDVSSNISSSQVSSTKPVDTSKETSLSVKEVLAGIPSNLKGTTINIFNWNPPGLTPGASEAMANFKKLTGITIKWTTGNYDEYISKITAMVAANQAPDIIRVRDADVALIKNLQPLDNLGYNFNDTAWNDELMNLYKMNGKRYVMILNDTPFFLPAVTYYNRSLVAKYRLEDPYDLWKSGDWTWNKLKEMCESFLDKANNDRYDGLIMSDGGDYNRSQGVTYITYDSAKSKYVNLMKDERLVKGWQFTAQAVQSGLFSDTVYDTNGFDGGNALFINNSLISARTTHNYFSQLISSGDLGTVPMPAVDGQKTYYLELTENEGYAVPKGAKNAKAVPYFLRYYLDSSTYNLDDFFCDEQAREVYEYCKTQKNYMTTMERIVYREQYGASVHDMSYTLRQTEISQIKSVLAQYNAGIQKCVNQNNSEIAKLAK